MVSGSAPSALAALRDRLPELLADLATLVEIESPSHDLAATAAAAAAVAALGERLVGRAPEQLVVDGRTHLRWTNGPTRVLLVGHFDTVWPAGTLARWPFTVADERATGPGCFDMKAGVVQLLHAVALLGDDTGVTILLTSDEELGSPTSRSLVEEAARGADAALVLEPSADGALKAARKSVGMYRLDVTGRAAHAGLEPENGINASVELAHQVLALAALNDPVIGTTVTPTVITGGSVVNAVPAAAHVDVDVRAWTLAEVDRVDAAIRALAPQLPGAELSVSGGANRPPLEAERSAALFDLACTVANELGLPPLAKCAVGGGSDGNFTAGLGVPTLDGLGAVGGGAHAEGEWVSVPHLAERAALVHGLLEQLRGEAP